MKLANVIAVIGLTALLVVTGLMLLEVLMRAGPVLALRDAYPGLDDRLRQWGMDGLSDLYAPLGIVAVAACLPAMLPRAARSPCASSPRPCPGGCARRLKPPVPCCFWRCLR